MLRSQGVWHRQGERIPKRVAVKLPNVLVAGKVKPVAECLVPLAAADLAGVEAVEVVRAAVVGPNERGLRNAGCGAIYFSRKPGHYSITHFLRHVFILARLSLRRYHQSCMMLITDSTIVDRPSMR